jgi:hypothetical protein
MKIRTIATVALCAAFCCLLIQSVSAENIIRQTELATGLQYDQITDDDDGIAFTHLPIVAGGASYDLFARGSAWDTTLYYLDTKIVGHYMPTASIEIVTGDYYHEWVNPELPPRTRADQPYQLAITVSGLVSDPAASAAAKQVLYTHVGQNYNTSYVPGTNEEYTIASFYMGNSDPSFTPVYTSLTPMAPTKAMGVETFTVSSISDASIPDEAILDDAVLVVWPISEATIKGVSSGEELRDALPALSIHYKDLYPLSLTYVQIYAGAPALGTVGTAIDSTVRWHNTTVPQNELISIENWEKIVPIDGQYTLEVLSITPFDNWQPERLEYITFDVNRRVNINAQAITSEK